MSFPLTDWQFWVATVVVIGVVVLIARKVMPSKKKRSTKRVGLTIEGDKRSKR